MENYKEMSKCKWKSKISHYIYTYKDFEWKKDGSQQKKKYPNHEEILKLEYWYQ